MALCTQGRATWLTASLAMKIYISSPRFHYPGGTSSSLLGLRVAGHVVDGVIDAEDLVRIGVRNLDGKLLLQRHHKLHNVQAVQA